MYRKILKKDLKRKKTMNIILLIFIILATMFVSSSVNNIITVSNAMDHYFKIAKVPDYFMATKSMGKQDEDVIKELKESSHIKSYGIEPVFYAMPVQFDQDGEEINAGGNPVFFPLNQAKVTYFDENNHPVDEVNPGEIRLSQKVITRNELGLGDMIHIQVGNTSLDLKLVGGCKDAVLGSDMMGISRFFLSQSDYDQLMKDPEAMMAQGSFYYVDTDDTEAVADEFANCNDNIIFMGEKDTIAKTYIMDMVTAGMLLIISTCLILIAFLALRFTIVFTLSQEFREIGVMKAIGIHNHKIRSLYLVKYLAISVVGAIIGVIGGIPFGDMLIKSVSKNMVMESEGGYIINLLCGIGVVAVIMLFCYLCTRRVNKLSPIDAIRNGSNGERYRGKGILRLSKSHLRPVRFMSINDILSNIKRYLIMMITFVIGLTLILLLVNTFNTLTSNQLMNCFSMVESDLYIENEPEVLKMLAKDGKVLITKRLNEVSEELEQHSIPNRTYAEILLKLTITHGEHRTKSLAFQGVGTTTKEYQYLEGSAPINANEIAMTKRVAEKLHVILGDTVKINIANEERAFIITALYESMNNMGEGIRFSELADISYEQSMGSFLYQIQLTDAKDQKTFNQQIEEVKKLFDGQKVYVREEYVDFMIGGLGNTVKSVRKIAVLVVLLICTLIAVLMERSLITKEKGEIAIVKAIGFSNSSIIAWHTIRLGLVLLISVIISVLLATPATSITSGQVFKTMGAGEAVEFEIKPLEVYVIYPLLTLGATVLATMATAISTRKISATESSNIE